MSNIIYWIKSNLVIVICFVVIAAAVCVHFLITQPLGKKVASQMSNPESQYKTMVNLINNTATLPGVAEQYRGTITQEVVDVAKRNYEQINGSFEDLVARVIEINRMGPDGKNVHEVIDSSLFPNPGSSATYRARSLYREGIQKLYRSLKPGMPLTEEQVHTHQLKVQNEFKMSSIPMGDTALTDAQKATLKEKLEKETQELIVRQASSMHIYAQPTNLSAGSYDPGAFSVGLWVQASNAPSSSEVWEGQMSLWIQQDVVKAILKANSVQTGTGAASVIQQPIKRLISIEVLDNYVGVQPPTATSMMGQPVDVQSMEAPVPLTPPQAFKVSFTGRVSNPLYDVRQVRVKLYVDAKAIPQVLDAFKQVNLMTPMIEREAAVDERADFQQYYYYGPADVVELDLLMESIWMRQWTAGSEATPEEAINAYQAQHSEDEQFAALADSSAKIGYLEQRGLYNPGLMPDSVRYRLGLRPRDPSFVPEASTDQMRGPSMNPYDDRGSY